MIKYRVISNSMEPLIPTGSELILEKVDSLNLKQFDIIVFEEKDMLICHYISHINKLYDRGYITTKSLLNGLEDVPFSPEKVKGRVTNFKISTLLKLRIFFRLI